MWQVWVGRGIAIADVILFTVEAIMGVPLGWHQPVILAASAIFNIILGQTGKA